MTTGLSAPDTALVHGFRGGEDDTGDADNPETNTHMHTESEHAETERGGPQF